MELGKHIVVTVFGVGKIGKRVYELLESNGLTVQAVDIREEYLKKIYGDNIKFITKEEAIKNTDVIINTMNLTRNSKSKFYNIGYFSEEYLNQGKNKLIFINVTRGEIAPEKGLLNLYNQGKIIGIGLDVFTDEAKFAESLKSGILDNDNIKASKIILEKSIDRTANFYVQPHQGFNSDLAAIAKAKETIKHVCTWYKNNKEKFDEQLPYYKEED